MVALGLGGPAEACLTTSHLLAAVDAKNPYSRALYLWLLIGLSSLIVSREGIKFSGSVGFRNGSASVHTSRTMMLAELRILLDHVAAGAAAGDYTESIMDENILGKPTRAARQKTARRLRELYGVDPHCTLFRWLRHFWTADTHSQPMLAFLVAAARDPLLRETTPIVQEIPLGQSVSSTEIAKRLVEKYPQRFSPTTQLSTAQNLASSWSQAGYLKGRAKKIRTRPYVTPVVATFALLIGYLCGLRGSLLLNCVWTRLLDYSTSELTDLVTEASKQGWLRFKASGSVLEISFPGVLTPAEEKPAYESH
jgi:hypothetical protein